MNLTSGQKAVLKAFHEFGAMTDVALATYVHHVAQESMSSSGIRTRRHELGQRGLLQATGTKTMKSGRKATVYTLNEKGVKVAWEVRNAEAKAQTKTTRVKNIAKIGGAVVVGGGTF